MDVICSRFDFARRTLQSENSAFKLQYLLQNGPDEYLKMLPQIDSELKDRLEELDRFAAFIRASNEPSLLPRIV